MIYYNKIWKVKDSTLEQVSQSPKFQDEILDCTFLPNSSNIILRCKKTGTTNFSASTNEIFPNECYIQVS